MLFRTAWVALAALSVLQVPSFHTEARLVVLHVSVRNGRGEVVTNLNKDAFSVYENGKAQPVTVFRRDDVPVSVGLLIDNSGSMRSIRGTVEAAALAFAKASNPDDELFVMNFADKPELDVPFTSDRDVLARGIARVDAVGGTAMRDAVQEAERYVREHGTRERRALVVVTDGRATAGPDPVARAHRAAAQLVSDRVTSIVVDCESGRMRMGLAADLARHLNAEHVPLGQVNAQALADIVRGATSLGAA